ncbi:MAG TPA: hypothetical protein V6D22_21775 [Candidatus Obscuribacterales bacterium]
MQNVEPNPYKKETVASSFISMEALAAVVCMALFLWSVQRYDTMPSEKGMDDTNSPEIIEKAMELKPGKLAAEGKMDDAVKEASTLIDKKKYDTLANVCAGNVFIAANLRADGLKYLKNSVALSHRNRYVIENYAEKLAEVGQTEEAIAQFEALVSSDKDKNWVKPHLELAMLYMQTEKPGDAADQLKSVVAANEHNFVARKMRGIALARSNQLKQGLDEYVRAISDESRTGVPDAIKSLLGSKGTSAIDKVTYELQQQINNHPDEYVPKLRLGQLYEYQNQLNDAKAELLDARRLQPNNPEVLRTLAVVQKELGEDNQAMSNFKLSVNIEAKQEKEKSKDN